MPSKEKLNSYFELMQFAEKWYSPKKFQHACRVAAYAYQNALTNDMVDSMDAAIVGLAHDLLEDTDAPSEELEAIIGNTLISDVLLLSKDDNMEYKDYIKEIINEKEEMPIAFIVKRADMKDHMTQTDTLTDKLKDKYLPVLHYFM